ncbi:hypothetical protein N5853_13745 (plasmid) [Bartonella sp. HY329]|uniref:hypothetical protein n=1 Tax=unclassified Bartonella TaxID=2645622 RepID=UPI0021C5A525|nr:MULTISPECIES: hypothetical protein [unclassified Bartonella]UXM96595.1 hypothetical protein N5853_13745 [Bartonella sp. HY329]UXN10918.1 hypothetical protein N5852_13750 [Bartonella sp. HY328]
MKYILIFFFTLNIYETYAQEVTEKQYKHIMSICSDVTSFVNNNNGDLKRINKKTFIYNSINDTKTCPDNCITNKYLIANDVVLAGIQYKKFTCFMYKINDSKYISGWVKTGDLSSIKNRKYADKELSGNWISDDEYRYLNIDLKIIDEKLHMFGSSSFKFNNDNNLRNYNADGILEYDSGI